MSFSNKHPQKPQWQPPLGTDPECIAICTAMNRLPGIHTYESCCGHGDHDFWVFLTVDDLYALRPLLYYLDPCHCGRYGWQAVAFTDCSLTGQVKFRVEGPTGPDGYEAANHIANRIEEYLDGVEEEG